MANTYVFSEDEIIRDWTLDQKDMTLVSKVRKSYRLWVAIQLCALKLFGQFLENPNDLASEIIAYMCKQLSIPIVATVAIPQRDSTKTAHKKLVFKHLKFSKFSDANTIFKSWVQTKVDAGIILAEQIFPEAEKFLIKNKIAVPTAYKLTRAINSVCYNRQE